MCIDINIQKGPKRDCPERRISILVAAITFLCQVNVLLTLLRPVLHSIPAFFRIRFSKELLNKACSIYIYRKLRKRNKKTTVCIRTHNLHFCCYPVSWSALAWLRYHNNKSLYCSHLVFTN